MKVVLDEKDVITVANLKVCIFHNGKPANIKKSVVVDTMFYLDYEDDTIERTDIMYPADLAEFIGPIEMSVETLNAILSS